MGVEGKGCGSGSVAHQHCIDLSAQFFSDKLLGGVLPDGEDAADGEVSVYDGASVERVEGDDVTLSIISLSGGYEMWSFFAGEVFDGLIFLEDVFNDFIAFDVLVKLLISEFVD